MLELQNTPTNYSMLPPEAATVAVNFDTRQATESVTVYATAETETGTVQKELSPNITERTGVSYADNISSPEIEKPHHAQRLHQEEALRKRRFEEQRSRDHNHQVRIVKSVRTNGDRTYRLRPATPAEIKEVAVYGSRRTAAEHNRLILDAPADGQKMDNLDVTLRITQAPENIHVPDSRRINRAKLVPAGTALLRRKGYIEHRVPLGEDEDGNQTYRIDRQRLDELAILADQEAIDALIMTNPPTEDERRILAEENAREKDREERQRAIALKRKWLGAVAVGALVAVSIADMTAQLVGQQQTPYTRPPIHRQHTQTGQSHATDKTETSGKTTILLTAQVKNKTLWSFEAEQLNIAEPGLEEKNPTLFNTEVQAWVRASEGLASNSTIENYRHMPATDGFTAYTAAAMVVYDQMEHPPVGAPSEGGGITLSSQKNAQDVAELSQAFISLEQFPVEGDGLNDQKDAKTPVVKAAAQKIGKLLQKFANLVTLKTD